MFFPDSVDVCLTILAAAEATQSRTEVLPQKLILVERDS